jgi:hypothetical protein
MTTLGVTYLSVHLSPLTPVYTPPKAGGFHSAPPPQVLGRGPGGTCVNLILKNQVSM